MYTASNNKLTDLINVFEISRASIASDSYKNISFLNIRKVSLNVISRRLNEENGQLIFITAFFSIFVLLKDKYFML